MAAETIHACQCGPSSRGEAHPERERHYQTNLFLSRLDEDQRRWYLALAQLLEARENLQQMMAQIPLTDDERDAVEDGSAAVEQLLERLTDVPTPAGPTPRQLAQSANFIPLATLGGARQSESP